MKTVQIRCANCHKTSAKPKKEIERRRRLGKRRFFCSLSCGAQHQAAHQPPGRSRAVRHKKARKAYTGEWVCADCGEQGRHLDIHHINEDTWDNSNENLVALCRGCHTARHNRQTPRRPHQFPSGNDCCQCGATGPDVTAR